MPWFAEDDIKELYNDCIKTTFMCKSLVILYSSKKFLNEQAVEYVKYGFIKRIIILEKCLNNIYKICPPEQHLRLKNDNLLNTKINLQAFYFNIFGCLENLAMIWVKENAIKNSKDKPLKNYEIGFGEKYKFVRESFPKDFRSYLESLRGWFSYIENYRHALAHRIPLYIPSCILNKEGKLQEKKLKKYRNRAFKRGNFKEYDNLTEQLDSLGVFIPITVHSCTEKYPLVVFHYQIIEDLNIIFEISIRFLKALKIFSKANV